MSEPFLGEMRIVSFGFAPKGWAMCNGQPLPINQNQALFSLLGTMYGGNGQTTFALPNLQGRTIPHVGAGLTQGQVGGEQSHTVTVGEMAAHNHPMLANNSSAPASLAGVNPDASKALAQGLVSLPGGKTTTAQIYGTGTPDRVTSPAALTNSGGSQPHENRQPFLAMNIIIALQGIFPSQN